MMLKAYKKGYQFIDSLKINDFRLPYKKELSYNYFMAMEYESEGDTVNRDKRFLHTISVIENYIKRKPQINIDEEACYDLFLIKSKVTGQTQVKQEISQLKQKYPQSIDFLNTLESSLYEDIKTSYFRQY